jgi:hypothetical protein
MRRPLAVTFAAALFCVVAAPAVAQVRHQFARYTTTR